MNRRILLFYGGFFLLMINSFAQAFLEPTNGAKLLFIGQDLQSVTNYGNNCASCPTPGGVATYVNIAEILNDQGLNGALGWGTNDQPNGQDLDWGGGPLNAHSAAVGWPNSALQIGLYMVGNEQGVAQGNFDAHIDQMGDFFKSLSTTAIYLRIGYEFDGNWNGYNPTNYINAYRRIVDKLRNANVNNVAYVWQSSTSPIDDILDGSREDLNAYYPGDNYVDWFGMSWFLPPNESATVGTTPSTQLWLANELVALANQRGKPVMICEATPQGYDLANLTNRHISSVWDGTAGQGQVNKTANQIWNEWFVPYFDFINNNSSIKAVTYINANWDVQGLWDPPYDQGYWGDTRIEANNTIENNWVNTITQSGWLHGSTNLNNQLHNFGGNSGGGNSGGGSETCSDGIQNQDETGIDCGGVCTACPTCSDGIQNQGETGVDCGGPCSACSTGGGGNTTFNCPTGFDVQCTTNNQCFVDVNQANSGGCATSDLIYRPGGTCSDGVQNQGETGVDCGGPCSACSSGGGGNTTFNCPTGFDVQCTTNNQCFVDVNQANSGGCATSDLIYRPGTQPSGARTASPKSDPIVQEDATIRIDSWSIYPNPVNDRIFIKGSSLAVGEFYVFNAAGKLVKRVSVTDQIDVSELKPGLYLIRNNQQSIRFIKK